MAGIKQPLQDILAQLAAIQVTNMDNQVGNLYSRVWNNQLQYMDDGSGDVFPRPAAFVEVVSPAQYEAIGLGFRSADLGFRIHLIHDFYNQDGTMEQDLGIFDLRDMILANHNNPVNPGLSLFCPTACGAMVCVSETQDYSHKNIYHYILDFVCNFTDSKGSGYDTNAGQFDDTPNANMDTEITATIGESAANIPDTTYFIIPQ